jgi:hypothetical protein
MLVCTDCSIRLRRLDFVYKKPKAIPGKADKAEQEKFLRMIEAKLAENSRETAVYYADRQSLCSKSWSKKIDLSNASL